MQPALKRCKMKLHTSWESNCSSIHYRYDIMKQCWMELPDKRPNFSKLVTTISTSLEAIAGYLDLTVSPLTPAGNSESGSHHVTVTIADEDGDNMELVHNLN